MRLLLSGGSHRATFGSIGAIGYFLWSESTAQPHDRMVDRWSDVDEVVSVSGGSLLNAALATSAAQTADETAEELAAVRRRIIHDRLLPHRSVRRMFIVLTGIVLVVLTVWAAASAAGLIGPAALQRRPWPFIIGLAILPVVVGIGRRIVGAYQRDVIDRVTQGGATRVDSVHTSRRHTICSSGLSSGLPYYFVAGGTERFVPSYGATLTSGFSTAQAAAASMALPGLGSIRAPIEFRKERLVDGGVSGGLGEQVSTTIQRRPEDTWRSDEEWFAVDAVRHMTSDSQVAQLIQSVSYISLLSRWLKVSLEATYVNDLMDLGPGRYARVWTPNPLPNTRAMPKTAVMRDGSTTDATVGRFVSNDERRSLGALQVRVAGMGLFSMNEAAIDLGIVAGFVSTLEVRRGLSATSVIDGLTWLDAKLQADGQLLALWTEAAASLPALNEPTSASPDAS